jgi:CheY-like chemotaxis protein
MSPLLVLAVDDEPMNLDLASVILEREGHQVITALDGRAALERADEYAVDLILMDINMPEMDGYEAIRALRARPKTANVIIIVVSGSNSGGEAGVAIAAGADLFMSKPYRRADLLAAIDLAISRRSGVAKAV